MLRIESNKNFFGDGGTLVVKLSKILGRCMNSKMCCPRWIWRVSLFLVCFELIFCFDFFSFLISKK